jgi:GNAT superfamily N-acetyltransferase
MSIVIREARHDELDAVARVLAAAFEQYRAPAITSSYRLAFERHLEEIVDVRARIGEAALFVAVEGPRVVGTGTLYPPGRSVAYGRTIPDTPWPRDWAWLRVLGVAPSHRGRGIGRLLVEARVQRARELAATAVALHTSPEFEVLRHLVRRMGWTRSPEHDFAPAPGARAEGYFLALA